MSPKYSESTLYIIRECKRLMKEAPSEAEAFIEIVNATGYTNSEAIEIMSFAKRNSPEVHIFMNSQLN